MQSEEFDSKIKDAAEHHHPAYDEKAWEKMEKLLNKHLPQKKDDRRRVALILLFILLLGGGGFLLVARPWKANRPITNNKEIQVLPTTPDVDHIKKDIGKSSTPDVSTNDLSSRDNKMPVINEENGKIIPGRNNPVILIRPAKMIATGRQQEKPDLAVVEKNDPMDGKNKELTVTNDPVVITGNSGLKEPVIDKTPALKDDKPQKELREATENKLLQQPQNSTDKKDKTDPILKTVAENGAVQKITEPSLTESKTYSKKIKDNKKKSNSFFLTLSLGPDVSAAGTERLGKMKMIVGGGIGYTFSNKFSVKAGIYSSRQIYTASPYEYHPPDYFWGIFPDLKQIDADCKIIEIPLSLSYNFSSSARQSWFGTIGLSSYLMKRETYNYWYKNSSGQLLNWEATIKNANKHYFSVLTLSGGYERKINNTFSIMAEPFLKIPMIGIGYGKVKLSSAGLLFSVGIHPFHSAKGTAKPSFH